MPKKQWDSLKKKLEKLDINKRISLLNKLLKKERDKIIRIEIEKEITKLLPLIIKSSRKPQVIIASDVSPIETTAAERQEKTIRPELERSLENILLTTPVQQNIENDQKNYSPSLKYNQGNYRTFRYEDITAKYKPPVDRKTVEAIKPDIDYVKTDSSPMLEKLSEEKKLEESSKYKTKNQKI